MSMRKGARLSAVYQGKQCRSCGSAERYTKTHQCRTCRLAAVMKWRSANPEQVRLHRLRHQRANASDMRRRGRERAGWLDGEHDRAEAALLVVTCCSLCQSESPRHKRGWKADHCHETHRFRAYLCHPCNARLGFAECYNLPLSAAEQAYIAQHRVRLVAS